MDQKDNAVIFKLKGIGVVCPIPNIPLTEVVDFKGLIYKEEQFVGICDEFLKCVKVHLKNGVVLPFFEWYEDNTDFVDEPLAGFSGPEHVRIKIILKLEN